MLGLVLLRPLVRLALGLALGEALEPGTNFRDCDLKFRDCDLKLVSPRSDAVRSFLVIFYAYFSRLTLSFCWPHSVSDLKTLLFLLVPVLLGTFSFSFSSSSSFCCCC